MAREMTAAPSPTSRQELVDQYRSAVGRTDWAAMLAAQEGLAARAEYDVALEIRRAQEALRRARTQLEAAQTERSVVKQALEDARERAPLAAEQAAASGDLRKTAEVHAAAAWWRDQIPTREDALQAAEGRCRDADQSASDAQATLDRLLAAASARVQPGATEENKV
jgi:predicted  nucleic acid-binding Zn-ribbon protein